MKRVKCYGKVNVKVVESSFKRNFFGPFNCRNSNGNNSFQEFQQESSSFSSVASTDSNFTDIHSIELFALDACSFDKSLSISSPCTSRNIRKKKKYVKHSVASKACLIKKHSLQSTSHSRVNVVTASTRKAKKLLKKHTRTSKSYIKQKISKQIKPSVTVTALYSSHSDLGLSCRKSGSKNVKHLKSYKKGILKRNHKTNRLCNLNKHSSIPIQPSCSYFCENPSSIINTGMKKTNKKGGGKKQQLINKGHDVTASYCSNTGMIPSFDSKHDSFWAAIQPRWSSIYKYSFEIENVSKEKKKIIRSFVEQHTNKNVTFLDFNSPDNKLLSNEESISVGIHVQSKGSNSCKQHAVENSTSTGEFCTARNDSYLKLGNNFNISSLETVDNRLKAAKDISKNVVICKTCAVGIITDRVFDQSHPKMDSADIPCVGDKEVSNLCETVSEKLNDKDENTSKGKSVNTCRETAENKIDNKDFITTVKSNFTASRTLFENINIFKINKDECLSANRDQLQENAATMFKKSKGFYSSTPITSSSTYTTIAKDSPFARSFSPVLQKDRFLTSTPTRSSKVVTSQQNHICNANRISYLGRQCSSIPGLNTDSYISLQKCPSTKINSSLLSRKNKSHISFINSLSRSYQNTYNRLSRSCISFSRREQSSHEESHCSFKALHSPIAGTSAESNFNSTLSKLLGFCGQTSVIPFNKLYDWSRTTVRKIGEGTYGEVFSLVKKKISSVIKVIPFSEDNEDHSMQSIEAVLSEVTVSQCLSELRKNKNYKTRNFNKLKSVHLVKGCYPGQMLVAWDKYSVARSTYNSRPDIFNDQQMFAIIELEYGGKDMTCFMLKNAVEAESIVKQIAISLAIAEEAHLFEHRDLHLGNILVQRNTSKKISYVLGGKSFSIPNHGIIVTIIDFTLSRVLHEGCIFYNDIDNDDSLFNQTGDFQFQIYKDTKLLLNNEWHKCLLYSNVLWLTYLCVKLLESNYSRPSSKIHKESLKKIKTFQDNLRICQSAFECLTACNILASVPKHEQGSAKKMAMKAKFVDRNSFQKSVSLRTSNVM